LFFQLGFVCAFLRRIPRAVDEKLMRFHRAEQMSRLRELTRKELARLGLLRRRSA
jgi:hypothetical protein